MKSPWPDVQFFIYSLNLNPDKRYQIEDQTKCEYWQLCVAHPGISKAEGVPDLLEFMGSEDCFDAHTYTLFFYCGNRKKNTYCKQKHVDYN